MPDKIIDIPNVGRIAFPESMSAEQMNAAAAKLYTEKNPTHPPPDKAHSWVDTAVDWLPAAGGALGGIVGGIGGTVAGLGVGGVPGAVGGAALGGATGEAAKQLINRARGASAPSSSGDAAWQIGTQAGVQGAAELAGAGLGAAMAKAGPRVMQAAVKPTLSMLQDVAKGAPVPRVVQTLLDEGVNVTPHGFQKLQSLLGASRQELRDALATATANGAPGVNPYAVTSRLAEPAARVAAQVNPRADLEAIGNVGNEFIAEHGSQLLSLADANALKQGTYQTLRKKYGQLGSADIEGQKALARGLKEEIEAQAPGVDQINARIGGLTEAAGAVGRRVAVAGNRDPIGFSAAAHTPQMFLASLLDRSPAVKSFIARGLYQQAGAVARVSPQLIRAAIVALTSGGSGDAPAQE